MVDNNSFYILKERTPVQVKDVLTWANWFEQADRTVCETQISGGPLISTVFMGLNQNLNTKTPLLFETIVFGEKHNESYRTATWEAAENKHNELVTKHQGMINS